MRETLLRTSRIVVTTTIGTALVVLGIVLIPLPGPGLLIVIGGVAVLAREYRWARRVRDELKARAAELRRIAAERREAKKGGRIEPLGRTKIDDELVSRPDRHDIPA